MALHYYDHANGVWKTIDRPSREQIAEVLAAVRRPCDGCDALVDFRLTVYGPVAQVIHEDGCEAA